jgi:hypothetical protein
MIMKGPRKDLRKRRKALELNVHLIKLPQLNNITLFY